MTPARSLEARRGFAQMSTWDRSVDFVVIGSGAAGMTGALFAHELGASTLLVEKSAHYGGSTALSGGMLWVPANHLMLEAQLSDSLDEGLTYLEGITNGTSSVDRLRAYLETAPAMVRYLADRSHVRFNCVRDYPDYYPERPGGRAGGRSIEPVEFDAHQLGIEFAHQRVPSWNMLVLGLLQITVAEVRTLTRGGTPALRFLARHLLRYLLDIKARRRGRGDTRLTLGPALVARLRRSLMDRDVPLWLRSRLRDFVMEDGRVAGVVIEREGRTVTIRARKGVLLAAGGFERNAGLRQRYQQQPIGDAWTVGCADNTGDWLVSAQRLGAELDLMEEAWWTPVLVAPDEPQPRVMIVEKGLPGSLIVDQRGERFVNEAAPYNDIGRRMFATHAAVAPAIPAYFVFDGRYRKKYAVGPVMPGSGRPDWTLSRTVREGFLTRAPTIPDLAAKLGIERGRLERTIQRYNHGARAGRDPDYGRGDSLQDRYYSDPDVAPNPCLGPIDSPPFYAVRVYPGDLGTKGGLRTDTNARVLTAGGEPILGLYAAGNCSASVMGTSYPGAGGTIGPAMTFACIAAHHAVGGTGVALKPGTR